MNSILNFLKSNSSAISAGALIIGGFWALWKFREYLKDKRFKTYHELINELVNEQRNPDRVIKLDRQIAIIYELRNYPSYYPLTIRILSDLKEEEHWKKSERITKEIDCSLRFMKSKCFSRIWIKIMKKY